MADQNYLLDEERLGASPEVHLSMQALRSLRECHNCIHFAPADSADRGVCEKYAALPVARHAFFPRECGGFKAFKDSAA
jgi:hypothetical protein